MHKPVLAKEVLEYLRPQRGEIIMDATLGGTGHAGLIIEKISPGGMLIGIDKDEDAIRAAKGKLEDIDASSYILEKADFRDFDSVLRRHNIEKINGALFDLGVSSFQLDDAEKGFSFNNDGPLDMRMNKGDRLTAQYVVNKYPEHKLFEIIKTFGEERYARRIARSIVGIRKKEPFRTTTELADAVKRAVGYKYGRSRIHPATRTFQAIRIEVNSELDALKEALEKLPQFLKAGARVCVISFHSLEDRIVKNFFRDRSKEGLFRIVTKKPVTGSYEEVFDNPRARSAKLRAAEFTG